MKSKKSAVAFYKFRQETNTKEMHVKIATAFLISMT